MSLDIANMTQEQMVEAVAEELATVAWDLAVAKAAPIVQNKAVKLGSNILKKIKPGNLEQAVLKTAEGLEVKAPHAELAQETNVLQNAAEKITRGRVVQEVAVITTSQATKMAEQLGFKKTNYFSSGQRVFQKGNRFIAIDVDSHSGGVWKMADSVKNLAFKSTRMGTYDQFLNRIGD